MNKIKGSDILSLGCKYNQPKGGVAQVLYTYDHEVYESFRFIANSCYGNFFVKSIVAIGAFIHTFTLLLFSRKIRIVHIHTASYNSFRRSSFFVSLAKFMKRKVVLHIHGGGFKEYYLTNPNWILSVLQKCDSIIALTDRWKIFFEGIGCSNVTVVKNVIPSPQIRDVNKDGIIHLLFLGWIVKEKGIFDLADVINNHKTEWQGRLKLHIGGSHEVEHLQNYIKHNNLENLICYEGWVSGEKKICLLNLMDAFILPSYKEGMPISILEALSYGKPVITTPVGGIPDVVNNENGFFITPGNKQEMADLLECVISNPAILQQKAVSAQKSVINNYPNAIAQVLDGLYCNLK